MKCDEKWKTFYNSVKLLCKKLKKIIACLFAFFIQQMKCYYDYWYKKQDEAVFQIGLIHLYHNKWDTTSDYTLCQ